MFGVTDSRCSGRRTRDVNGDVFPPIPTGAIGPSLRWGDGVLRAGGLVDPDELNVD